MKKMEDLKALSSLLEEENVQELQKGLVEIILDRVRSDLDESGEFLIAPDDIEELLEEVREEAKEEIKKKYRDKIMAEIDAKFASPITKR